MKEITSLVLTRFRPDRPKGGAALRNWQNIRCLARLGPVDVVSVDLLGEMDGKDIDGIREWRPFSLPELDESVPWLDRVRRRLWMCRAGVHPSIDSYYHSPVARCLKQLASRRRYDIAVVEELSMASYIPLLKSLDCRVVFDDHNVESRLRSEVDDAQSAHSMTMRARVRESLLRRRMSSQERRAVLDSDLVWTCSRTDSDQIEQLFGRRADIFVVPNSVDVDSYRPAVRNKQDWQALPITMVYPASFSYFPNEDAALRLMNEVLPAVRALGRKARVLLIGRDPTPAMFAAASKLDDVEITGAVPSVTAYLHEPCVVVLPIYVGSGTRLKILEAFAAGCPVISTAKGAEGIDAVDDCHLMLREDARSMAQAAVCCWEDASLRESLCENALELVRREYSWAAAGRRIRESLCHLLSVAEPGSDASPATDCECACNSAGEGSSKHWQCAMSLRQP